MKKLSYRTRYKKLRAVLEGMEFSNLDDLEKRTEEYCKSVGEDARKNIKLLEEQLESLLKED